MPTQTLPPRIPSAATESRRGELTAELYERIEAATNEQEKRELQASVTAVNMGVAQSIARRYSGRGERDDDLEQVAYVGLVKAVNGFDPGRGKNFLTYAVPTIAGELKRHFRDYCWTVRPPRSIQELQGRISACAEPLRQHLDRSPTPEEIAEEIGARTDTVIEALAADGCFIPTSLDLRVGEAGSAALGELLGEYDEDQARVEVHILLAPLVRELSARDRDIIALRFYHDWTQEQIAKRFGITQMQVSRLLSRMMRELRERIA